jgi:hypothetical protein
MRRSLNEVERLCQKAAEGAGAPAGLDTDAARAAAWLVARNLPALADLAYDLTRFADLAAACRFERESIGAATLAAGDKAVAVVAPSLIDLLVARTARNNVPAAIVVSGLAAPLFLLPPAARYGAEGWCLRLSMASDAGRAVLRVVAGGGTEILGPTDCDVATLFGTGRFWTLEAVCGRERLEPGNEPGLGVLHDAGQLAAAATESLTAGIDPDPRAWDRLQALAQKVLVPASEQSRLMGAGAGASDNE